MIEKQATPSLSPALAVARIAVGLLVGILPLNAQADDAGVIASLDSLRFQAPSKGTTRLVAGRTGQAQEFHFDKDSPGVFATSNIHGSADGTARPVSPSGSRGMERTSFGGLEFIFDDDYSVRYDLRLSRQRKGLDGRLPSPGAT